MSWASSNLTFESCIPTADGALNIRMQAFKGHDKIEKSLNRMRESACLRFTTVGPRHPVLAHVSAGTQCCFCCTCTSFQDMVAMEDSIKLM